MPHGAMLDHLRSGRLAAIEDQLAAGALTPTAMSAALAAYHAEIRAQAMELERGRALAQQARDRFALLFDALPVAAFLVDADGRIKRTNAQMESLLGVDDEGGAYLRRFGANADEQRRISALLTQAARSGAASAPVRLHGAGDSELCGDLQLQPLPPDGEAARGEVLGVFVDRTEQVRLHDAQRRQAMAEARVEQTHALMARISHELRTPLNAIIGFTQLIKLSPQAGGDDAKLSARIDLIEQAGEHLLSMVDDILAVARPDVLPQVTLQRQPLAPLIDEVAALVRPQADERRLRLVVSGPPAELALQVDEVRLRQILFNLLSNAIKYNRPEGEVALRCESHDGHVLISVTDDGSGLTPEQLERLFEPFNRLGRERSAVPGTGLGLAISRQLAHALGGELSVLSTPGCGARFTLRLPLAG